MIWPLKSKRIIYHGGLANIPRAVIHLICVQPLSIWHSHNIINNSNMSWLHLACPTQFEIWLMNSTSRLTHGIPQSMTTHCRTIAPDADSIALSHLVRLTNFVIHTTWFMPVKLPTRPNRILRYDEHPDSTNYTKLL